MTPQELALQNAQNWVNTLPPSDAAFMNRLMFQESGNDAAAVSSVGATGLGQIIPARWGDIATWLKAGNIPNDQWPPGLTPENIDNFATLSKRPMANAFMTHANLQMNREQALGYFNRKRPAGQKATTLLEAVGNDPRREAYVLAFGHKDGPARMKLFVDDNGGFGFEKALEFYEGRNARHQAKIKAAEDKGQISTVESLARQDAHGHAFGYADQIASAVGGATGLPPLELNQAEAQRMADLRLIGHTANNPAVQVFTDRGAEFRTPGSNSQSAESTRAESAPVRNPVRNPSIDISTQQLLDNYFNGRGITLPSSAPAGGAVNSIPDLLLDTTDSIADGSVDGAFGDADSGGELPIQQVTNPLPTPQELAAAAANNPVDNIDGLPSTSSDIPSNALGGPEVQPATGRGDGQLELALRRISDPNVNPEAAQLLELQEANRAARETFDPDATAPVTTAPNGVSPEQSALDLRNGIIQTAQNASADIEQARQDAAALAEETRLLSAEGALRLRENIGRGLDTSADFVRDTINSTGRAIRTDANSVLDLRQQAIDELRDTDPVRWLETLITGEIPEPLDERRAREQAAADANQSQLDAIANFGGDTPISESGVPETPSTFGGTAAFSAPEINVPNPNQQLYDPYKAYQDSRIAGEQQATLRAQVSEIENEQANAAGDAIRNQNETRDRAQFDNLRQGFLDDVQDGFNRRVNNAAQDIALESFTPSVFDNSSALRLLAAGNPATGSFDEQAANLLSIAGEVPDNSQQVLDGLVEFRELQNGLANNTFRDNAVAQADRLLNERLLRDGVPQENLLFNPLVDFDTNVSLIEQSNIIDRGDELAGVVDDINLTLPNVSDTKTRRQLGELSRLYENEIRQIRGSGIRPFATVGSR